MCRCDQADVLFPVACSAVVCLLTFTFQQPLQRSKHGCRTALLQFCTQVLHSCTAMLHNCTASLQHCTEPLHNCTTTQLQSYTTAVYETELQICTALLYTFRCVTPVPMDAVCLRAPHCTSRTALEYCTAPQTHRTSLRH